MPPGRWRTSRHGYADLTADVGAVLAALQSRLSGRRVVLLGHSLGGQLGALRLATAEEPSVAGLALVACGIPYYKRFPHAGLAVLGVTQVIRGTSAALGYWPGTGFGGRQASGVIRDWAYTARTGRFPILAGADTDAAIAGMTTPVLAVSISRDRFAPVPACDPHPRFHRNTGLTGTLLDRPSAPAAVQRRRGQTCPR